MATPHRIVTHLDELREKQDCTVYALAKEAGLSPQATALLLRGSGGKTLANLDALGAVLGVRLTWEPIKRRR
jgi:transcriptional regulator with XRE-family HTH domain